MKINTSTVAMESNRTYSEVKEKRISTATVYERAIPKETEEEKETDSADAEGQDKADLSKQAKEYSKRQQEMTAKKMAQGIMNKGIIYTPPAKATEMSLNSYEDPTLKLLDMMMDILGHGKNGKKTSFTDFYQSQQSSMSMSLSMQQLFFGQSFSLSGGQGGMTPGVGRWVKHTQISSFQAEIEHTTFSTVGIAKTEDGREIQFNLDLEMSRGFCQKFEVNYEEEVVFTDPLVINLGKGEASYSDKKFLFDLDADGKEESISQLNEGHGYLALDKNGDGKINDGSELFGAKTGDGFEELRQYDKDGNGWIDENDEVFQKLKVWTKDEDGNDKLISIAEAGIGAICLQSAKTDFTLRSQESGNVNAKIRQTGVYLKENGEVGTIQHVDVAG